MTSSVILERDGLKLRGYDCGKGMPVVFQHGLGGDEAQVADVFPFSGFRRLTLECRSHGASDEGDKFSIAMFADDVLAYADARGVKRFAVGGISMGAAIALRIAVIAPERVTALILARPAWDWIMAPENMNPFVVFSRYLATMDQAAFAAADLAHDLAENAPDNLASLHKFFDTVNPMNTAKLFAAIGADGPGVTEVEVRGIPLPTLVIGNAVDRIHPLEMARRLALAIPGARFVEIPAKALDKPRHIAAFRAAVTDFLHQQG